MSGVDDRTPLLKHDIREEDLAFQRFSSSRKKIIVAIVSWGGLVPCEYSSFDSCRSLLTSCTVFTSGTFIPSIPQIAKELETSGEAVR
jgi:hypothetical protein